MKKYISNLYQAKLKICIFLLLKLLNWKADASVDSIRNAYIYGKSNAKKFLKSNVIFLKLILKNPNS